MKTDSQLTPGSPQIVPILQCGYVNPIPRMRSLLLLATAVLLISVAAPAAVINWTNTSGGTWNSATNWSPNQVPGSGDDAFIKVSGGYVVTQDLHVTVSSLALGGVTGVQTLTNPGFNLTVNNASLIDTNGVFGFSGGTLAGAGVLTVRGRVVWTGGKLSNGTITVATNGTFDFAGSVNNELSGSGILMNYGLIAWSGAHDIYMANSARIINQPGALFDIQNNQSLLIYNGGYLTNRGTMRKSAGGGVTIITVPLVNSGTLDIQSGLVGYGASSQFDDGSAFTGAGTNLVYAGTATFNGAIASENLELAGATLAGNGSFSGDVTWTSGQLTSGTWTVATNGIINISGTATKYIGLSGMLINYGVVAWSGSNDIQTANLARIINQPGALFDIKNNQSLLIYNGGYFTNLGTLRKSAGGGITIITVPVSNSGVLDVQSGMVGYGANNQFDDGTSFTGGGTNRLYAGTATFNGAISSANLEIAGATIAGAGSFSGIVNWTGGPLSLGTMTIRTNGVLNITGTLKKDLAGAGTLINHGVVVWSGSNDIETANSARIINQPGALFDIQNNQSLLIYNGGYFTNFGTLRKSAGAGNTIITVPMINFGTLAVQSGLVAYGPYSQFHAGTAFIGPGTNLVYGGTVNFNGGISSENLELGGANIGGSSTFSGIVNWTSGALLDDSTLTIASNATLKLRPATRIDLGGELSNFGVVQWSGTNDLETFRAAHIINQPGALFDIQNDQSLLIWNGGAFTNLGTLRKSAATGNTHINLPFRNLGTVDAQSGTIIFANYTQAGGKLAFSLNSLTNFGRMGFSSGLALTGTIGANLTGGFTPVAGDTFEVINYPTHTGSFSEFDLPASHAWQTNSSIYSATAVTLTVLNSRPAGTAIASQTIDEQTQLSFALSGNDPDVGQILSYALLNPPAGASINASSGLFSWTPAEAQGPTTNSIVVQMADNGTPSLTATDTFTVVVNEVNLPPTLIVPAAQICDEMTLLAAPNSAMDADLPANGFHYTLVSGPEGVSLDPLTGALTWTPTEIQGPSTNTITIAVTDTGVPALCDTNSFTIVVHEVNRAPVLKPLANCTHVVGALCWITNAASDSDMPTQHFTFSLRNAPPGMSIGPTSGLVVWGPPANCAPLTNTVSVCVADDGSPALTDEQSFLATLISPPRLKIAQSATNAVVLSWPAIAAEAGFTLQSCTNFRSPAHWQPVGGVCIVKAGEAFLTNDVSGLFCAFRLASSRQSLPALQIARTATNTIAVSWPASATAVGFQPQITSDLAASMAWSNFVGIIRTNGSWHYLTDSASATPHSYRLRLIDPP